MKKVLKNSLSLKHWIAYLRRQPRHMQHVYAFIFSGTITAIIAGIILYADYGFWHDRYSTNEDVLLVEASTRNAESPLQMLSRFFDEAKVQLNNLNTSGGELLQGKETYKKGDD